MRLEQTRIYVRAEEERAASVQTRGAAAAATSALVLSLMVTIGRSLFGERDLSGLVFGFSFESGLRLAYVLALLSLLVSGFLAGAALWPGLHGGERGGGAGLRRSTLGVTRGGGSRAGVEPGGAARLDAQEQ